MSLSQIVEGWRNRLIPPEELKQKIQEVSDFRMAKCKVCPWNSDNLPKQPGIFVRPDTHCTNCGCNLEAKTKCFSCECPLVGNLKQWEAISTKEEWKQIEGEISNDGS